jgi:integrase
VPSRKRLPLPGDALAPAADDASGVQEPRRLVLRSEANASSVALVRRRGARAAAPGDGQAQGRRGGTEKRWQPPEGLTPEEVKAVTAAAGTERDRLLLRVLWATGGRVSEVLALRAQDVRRDALVLPNRKNPSRPVKTVFLSAGDQDLPGELLLWQKAQGLAPRQGSKRAVAGAGAGPAGVGSRTGGGAGAGAPPPPAARPGAADRAADPQPPAGAEAGRVVQAPDGLPDAGRRRGPGADAPGEE